MNQNDLILANAGITANIDESAQSPVDQALHDAYQKATIPSVTSDKLNLLAQRKQEKLAGLGPKYSVAKIEVGDDADTPRINDQANTTRIRGIDSFETYHGEDWLAKNRRHVDQQKAVLERQMGRPVTDQEVFAAGERQKNEIFDWLGGVTDNTGKPLPALGLVEQTLNKDMSADEKEHLYGRNLGTVKKLEGAYTDMQGNEVLPKDETWGSDHVYSRNDPYEYNPINKNVNLSAVQEEANKKAERDALWESIAGDKDGMFGESVDIAQSSLIQQYGKSNKALREMSRWAADKLGASKETIDEWLPAADKVGTIGYGDTTSTDLAKREVADKITGVMASTREEQDKQMKSALANVEKGNYGEAGLDVLTIIPYILGDSAGEIASLMAGYPGIALAVAGRVNEDAEEFKKNNDGKDVTAEWLMGSTLSNLGVLVGEKLIVGKVLGSMTKGLGNTLAQKGKDVFYATLGETAQEYADQTQQMYMTQKEGSNTLAEVATSPEAQLAALTGGAMGGVTSGTGFAGSAAISAADKGLEVLYEKIAGVKEDLANAPKDDAPEVPVKETYTDEDVGHLERHMSTLMEQYNTLGAQRRAEEKEAKKRGEEVVSKPSKDEVLARAGLAESATKILHAYGAKEKLTDAEKKRQGTLNAMRNGAVADLVHYTRDILDSQIAEGKDAQEAMAEGIRLLRTKEEDGGFGLSEDIVEAVAINAYGQPTQKEFEEGTAPESGVIVDAVKEAVTEIEESPEGWVNLDSSSTIGSVPKVEAEDSKSTEDTVKEQVNKAKASAEAEAKKGPKYENPYTEEDLNIEDQGTDTHSTISERSIDKVAKQFKIYNRQVKNSLDIALGLAKIRKMKVAAGKEANKVQYKMYYGDNGAVPLYIGYKTAVQKGDIDTAVKYAEKLQKRMYTQEVKLGQIEDTYTTVKRQLERAIAQMPKGTVEEQAKYLEGQFAKLATAKVDEYSMSITPRTAATDLITDSKLREALKLDEATRMNEIRSAVAESVVHFGQLLGREGLGRKAIKYETIDMVKVRKGLEADVAQIDKDLAAWEKVTNKLIAERELDEITEERLEIVEEQLSKVNKEVNSINREKVKVEKEIAQIQSYLETNKRMRKKALPLESTEDLKKKARKDAGKPVGSVKTKKELKELEENGIDTTHIPIEKDYKITTPEEVVEKVAKIKELQADKVEAKKVVNQSTEAKKFNDKMYAELDEWMIGKKTVEALAKTVNGLTDELNDLQQDKNRLTNEKVRAKRAQAKLEVHRNEIEAVQKDLEKKSEEVANKADKGFTFLKLAKKIKSLVSAVGLTVAQIKTLLTTRKLEEVIAELSDINARISSKEAEIRVNLKELTAEIKTESETKKMPSISDSHEMVASLLGNRNKTYRDLKSQKSDSVEKIKTLTERIRKLESELFGTTEARKLLENSAGSEAKVVKADGETRKVDQPMQLDGRIELKPTLLGQVKVEGLSDLIEDVESKQLFDDITRDVDKELAKLVVGPTDGIKSEKYAIQDGPAVGLLYTKDGKVNKQLAAVIALVATEYAGTDSGSLLHNSAEDIARMREKSSEYDVTREEKILFSEGKFRKVVASQLGSAITEAMGMKIAIRNVNGEMVAMLGDEHFDNIKQDLGQMALLYASSKGYIRDIRTEESKILAAKWNEYLPDEELAPKVDGVPMVYAPKMTDAEKEAYLEKAKILRVGMKNIKDSLNLQLREKTYQSTPQGKDHYNVRGSQFGAPVRSQNVLRTLANQEYKAVMAPLTQLVKDYEGGKRDVVMAKAGWKDTSTMTNDLKDDVDSQDARNREIEGVLDEIAIMHSKMMNKEISEGVFFEWFFSKNGRYMMDSTTVNPQVDKMFTRFLLVPKENVDVTWDLKDPKDKLFMQASIAQAFGVGIDKKSTEHTVKVAEVLMNAKIADLEALIYAKDGEITANVRGEDVTVEVKVEHIGHALQAIEGIKRLQAAGDKPFKATFTAEFDAVTSGFILKLMQIPLLNGDIESVKQWLRKGGVLVDEKLEDGKGINDLLSEKGTADSYQTLTKETHKIVKDATDKDDYAIMYLDSKTGEEKVNKKATLQWHALRKLKGVIPVLVDEDNNVTGDGRNLFKPTFMTFGYAAAITSIKRSLANNLAKSVMEGILSGSVKQENLIEFGIKATSTKTAEEVFAELQEELRTKPLDSIKLYKDVSKIYNKIYGDAVESVMNKIFGDMIASNKALTDGSKAMFRLFKVRYDNAIKEWQEANPGKPITRQLIEQTTRDLEKSFPLIKAPWSQNRNEGVAISDSVLSDRKNRQLPAAQTQAKLDDGSLKQLTVQGMMREMEEAFAAGAVLPIHWLDGSIIGTVLADGGVLGVHDAIVLGLGGKGSFDKVRQMNEATYRESVEYNVMEEMLDAVLEAYSDVTSEELAAVNAVSESKARGQEGPLDLGILIDNLEQIVKDSNKAREQIKGMTVGNIAGFAGMEFEAKDYEPTPKIEIDDIAPKASPKQKEDIMKKIYEAMKDC